MLPANVFISLNRKGGGLSVLMEKEPSITKITSTNGWSGHWMASVLVAAVVSADAACKQIIMGKLRVDSEEIVLQVVCGHRRLPLTRVSIECTGA